MTPLSHLILACGNTLRSDDAVGPHLAAWAEDHLRNHPNICVISRQQWTPDLAENIAAAQSVLFIDCSTESAPGEILLRPVVPTNAAAGLATHHQGAPELLALAQHLYGRAPSNAQLLTIGAASTELGEQLTPTVTAALPAAQKLIEETLSRLLATSEE